MNFKKYPIYNLKALPKIYSEYFIDYNNPLNRRFLFFTNHFKAKNKSDIELKDYDALISPRVWDIWSAPCGEN